MSGYIDDELMGRARARLARHTAECPDCRGVLWSLQRMVIRLSRLPPADSTETPDLVSSVRSRLHEPSTTDRRRRRRAQG